MSKVSILPTEKEACDFCGTLAERASAAWPIAFAAIHDATGADPDLVRDGGVRSSDNRGRSVRSRR